MCVGDSGDDNNYHHAYSTSGQQNRPQYAGQYISRPQAAVATRTNYPYQQQARYIPAPQTFGGKNAVLEPGLARDFIGLPGSDFQAIRDLQGYHGQRPRNAQMWDTKPHGLVTEQPRRTESMNHPLKRRPQQNAGLGLAATYHRTYSPVRRDGNGVSEVGDDDRGTSNRRNRKVSPSHDVRRDSNGVSECSSDEDDIGVGLRNHTISPIISEPPRTKSHYSQRGQHRRYYGT